MAHYSSNILRSPKKSPTRKTRHRTKHQRIQRNDLRWQALRWKIRRRKFVIGLWNQTVQRAIKTWHQTRQSFHEAWQQLSGQALRQINRINHMKSIDQYDPEPYTSCPALHEHEKYKTWTKIKYESDKMTAEYVLRSQTTTSSTSEGIYVPDAQRRYYPSNDEITKCQKAYTSILHDSFPMWEKHKKHLLDTWIITPEMFEIIKDQMRLQASQERLQMLENRIRGRLDQHRWFYPPNSDTVK